MAHHQVQLDRTASVAPNAALEIPFTPGAASNVEAWCDNDDDARIRIAIVAPDGTTTWDDGTGKNVDVQPTPAQVGRPWRARVTNQSNTAATLVLHVSYYSDVALTTEAVPRAKLDALTSAIIVKELHPRVAIAGKTLSIDGDPSLTGPLAKYAGPLDIPVTIGGFAIDERCISVAFVPATAGYPNGSLEIRLQCPTDVVVKKVVKLTLPRPRFVARVGINLYGGVLHLHSAAFELPPASGWVGAIVDALDVQAKLATALSAKVQAIFDGLAEDGTLGKIVDRMQQALGVARLTDLAITAAGIELTYEPQPSTGPHYVKAGRPPKSPRLEHLVVVMMENRSFDHALGDVLGDPGTRSETAGGKTYTRAKSALHALGDDPPHDSKSQAKQALGHFVQSYLDGVPATKHPGAVLDYLPREFVPFYDFLAREFLVCTDWRAALRGHTWPNRLYSLSGSSGNTLDNPKFDRFDFYTLPTICDVLEAQGVPWTYYKDDFAFLELYRRWVFDNDHIRPRPDFLAATALPAVTWIEPNISDFGSSRGEDDHPPISVLPGQRFLAQVYAKLCALPTQNWLLAITYDESGGFWDRAAPDSVPDDGATTGVRGFRVPAFLVSPWLRPGGRCDTRFDHASLIRTMLDQFCAVEPVFDVSNTRVKQARSFATVLDDALYALDAPRAMPAFDKTTIPNLDAGLGMAGAAGIADATVTPQTDLFEAFVAARAALAAPPVLPIGPLAGAGAAPAVRFEGLYVPAKYAELASWTFAPMFDDAFVARPPAPLAVDDAWDRVHDLRAAHPGDVIDPLWETRFPDTAPEAAPAALGLAGAGGPAPWHLARVKAVDAWQLPPPAGGAQRGAGIVIGHLDTGYREHPDLQALWQPKYGWDVEDDDPDPEDDLVTGTLKFPGHGTSTGSIIGSRGAAVPAVMGTAPEVVAIPFRISTSVVHLSMTHMARAIGMAVERGVHVISLSAGGLWSAMLHRAVREAVAAGVIVVAAAGNYTEIVVWPARFDEVIACGAVDTNGQTWKWSNGKTGPHVTVMAPGEDVWVLRPTDPTTVAVVQSSGTSFGTACTAGAVATWLGFHGRDKLVARYGRGNLAAVAKQLIRATTAVGGDAGELDMVKLLQAPLPDPTGFVGVAPSTADVAPVPAAIASLGLAAADPTAPFADEVAFHATVAKLTTRATVPGAAPGGAVPLTTLGAATAPATSRSKHLRQVAP